YGLLVVIGAARAFASPSLDSMLPQLISRRELANAQAWLASSGQLSSIGGLALAGFLIALFGSATWTYLIAAGCEALFFGALATLPAIRPTHRPGDSGLGDLFAGLGFMKRNPVVLAAITLDLFAVLFGGAVALLPIFARDIL